jgi:hypothetical protein
VDDQYVAVRAPRDARADAVAQQPLEDPGLARTDDDHVCVPLLGELDDRFRGLTDRGLVLGWMPRPSRY